MYSACQVKGPFDNGNGKEINTIPAKPREKLEIEPPYFESKEDKMFDEKVKKLSPRKLKLKADKYITENLNKYTKKSKKNQK